MDPMPHPSKKQRSITAIREELLASSTPELPTYSPSQLGSLSALVLLPDYCYCSTSRCVGFNPRASSMLIRDLSRTSESLEPFTDMLTPSQIFIVELLRVNQGDDVAESVSWYKSCTFEERKYVRTRVHGLLSTLAETLYDFAPLDLRGVKQPEFTFISFPTRLSGGRVVAPDSGRLVEFRSSIGWLCDIGDCVIESLASSKSHSEDDEIKVLIELAELLDARGTMLSSGGYGICDAVKRVRERYRELSAPGGTGPFFRCRSGVAALLNPNTVSSDIDWSKVRQGSSEQLAHEYAQKAESHFIVNFALTLIGDPDRPEGRPLRGLKDLQEHVAIPRIRDLLMQLYLLDRDKRIQAALEGPAKEAAGALRVYQADLDRELGDLSQAIEKRLAANR